MVIPLRDQAPDEREPAVPLRHSTVWDAEHTPVTEARQAVRALLARAGHPPSHPTSQDAQIVVSELVANAYRHAPGPGALLLEVVPDAALLRISVSDSSPDPPEPRAHDAGRIGGHGLHLVSRLCAQLNTVVSATGKKVVAHLRLHGTPADPVRQGAGAPMAGR